MNGATADVLTMRWVPFGSAHYSAIVVLREALLRRPVGLRLSAEDVRGEAEQFHLAAWSGDTLIGGLVLKPLEDGAIRLRQMVVAPQLHRRGFGTRLVREAERFAREQGYRRLVLHARAGAEGFYGALGYEPQGELFTEVTLPHRLMVKALT